MVITMVLKMKMFSVQLFEKLALIVLIGSIQLVHSKRKVYTKFANVL